jgi:hypothetical protein
MMNFNISKIKIMNLIFFLFLQSEIFQNITFQRQFNITFFFITLIYCEFLI